MKRHFHDTGLCVAHKHYMVDTTHKVHQVMDLIEKGCYFTMNRPRQFGKTTTLTLLWRELLKREEYLAVRLSFEGISTTIFDDGDKFVEAFVVMFNRELVKAYPQEENIIDGNSHTTEKDFDKLALQIQDFVAQSGREVVLLIDEVDKSTNNQLFLHFLGMLRDLYLKRDDGSVYTFASVILVGVHDVKTIKLKLRPDEERKFNSPWNIAIDFTVDLSFKAKEIETMLVDYAQDKQIEMDIPAIATRLYYYTSGYPYLVSKMCKVIDELLLPENENKQVWTLLDVENAFKYLTYQGYTTTLFDDMFKNLERHADLYDFIQNIAINGKLYQYTASNELVYLATIYGFIKDIEGRTHIHNRIFEQRLYHHFMSKIETQMGRDLSYMGNTMVFKTPTEIFMELVLRRFQQFMKEHQSGHDVSFVEREGRLLFLSFLRPIINGKGYDFKEPNVGEERRMDIVIAYHDKRYVLELKIWRGQAYHEEGLQQLSEYLDIYGLKQGYLLIFNFNKSKEYKEETIQWLDKEVFVMWV